MLCVDNNKKMSTLFDWLRARACDSTHIPSSFDSEKYILPSGNYGVYTFQTGIGMEQKDIFQTDAC